MFKRLFWLVLLFIFQPLALQAESGTDAAQSETAVQTHAHELFSPRDTMAQFIHAMNDVKAGLYLRMSDATATLDLQAVNPLVRNEQGENLAWLLLEIMDRTRLVDLQKVPQRQSGDPWVFHSYQAGSIRLVRQDDGAWRFDQRTVAALPAIWDEVEKQSRVAGLQDGDAYMPVHLRIRMWVPDALRSKVFLLENWRWVGILLVITIGVVIDKLASWLLRVGIRRQQRRHQESSISDVSEDVLRPLALMFMAGLWWMGLNLLGLPEPAMLILLVAVKFMAAFSGVWAAYRLVDIVGAYFHRRANLTETRMDDALVPLIPKTLKIFVTVVGIIFVADNLNINVSGLIAGLGLGGLAFALAAKDMVQNLFGSITILLDRTFAVGDWVIVDGVEGSVERIGFRSTKVRTFYNSVVTVPNSTFITASVDNMGERRFRRLSTKLGLAYETPPEKIDAFCEGIRELVRQHPYMRKDYYHIYFNGYADSALEILVYVFWETPEWGTELRERHRFLLDILRLAHELGVDFAYPTQTLYMRSAENESSPPAEAMTQAFSHEHGRNVARSIVEQSTGLNVKPPPVDY